MGTDSVQDRILAARGGDRHALGLLLEQFGPDARSALNEHLPRRLLSDLDQDVVMLEAYRRAFARVEGVLSADPDSFRKWVLSLVEQAAKDQAERSDEAENQRSLDRAKIEKGIDSADLDRRDREYQLIHLAWREIDPNSAGEKQRRVAASPAEMQEDAEDAQPPKPIPAWKIAVLIGLLLFWVVAFFAYMRWAF